MGEVRVVLSRSTLRAPMPAPLSAVRTQLVASIAERVDSGYPGRAVVAVDGRTGAGKTRFGHELAGTLAVRGRTVLRASLDDFKRPWRERHLYDRESGEGFYRHAYDYQALGRLLLAPFREGARDGVALCSIDPLTQVDHSESRVPVPEGSVLIVDGVFSMRPEIDHWWDVRVWLDVDVGDSFARGVHRDRAMFGDQAGSLHQVRYGAADSLYVSEVDPVLRADLVIDNRDLAAPALVRD